MSEIISVQNVSKQFKLSKKQKKIIGTNSNSLIAVNDLSLSIKKGEIFGLLGPNGAGKTTTLRMLATLIKPDKGNIIVAGNDVLLEPNKVRHKIGFLTNELKLDPMFTPNYIFDFFSDLYRISRPEKDRRKKILFERFGLNNYSEVKIGDLSTGNKQKISLLISIVNDPDIIIFDEPTNGLDILTSRIVLDFIKEQKSLGKTVILSSHIFSLVEDLCDRVAIIIDGKLYACDNLEHFCFEQTLENKFFEIFDEVKKNEE